MSQVDWIEVHLGQSSKDNHEECNFLAATLLPWLWIRSHKATPNPRSAGGAHHRPDSSANHSSGISGDHP